MNSKDHQSLSSFSHFLSMVDLTNLKSCQLSSPDENMTQLTISPKKSASSPPFISLSNLEVTAFDGDELKQVYHFHGEMLEKPGKLISCGNKSSQHASIEQEVSRCQTNYIIAIPVPKDDENNPDYVRSNDRIIKHSSMDSGRDLPEHLLFDILLWLPVITLLRFKSVCKFWYALIDSSIFIAQHFDLNCNKDNLLGVCSLEQESYDVEYEAMDEKKSCMLSGINHEVYNNFDCGQFWHFVEETNEAFSSNGIIAVQFDGNNLALWNPVMKQLKPLPKILDPVIFYCFFSGFGFDFKRNDYKYSITFTFEKNKHNILVEIYSLRADSWRSIQKDVAFPLGFYRLITKHISKNGTCFWIAYADGYNTHDDVLLSFDLNDETYDTMPLPVEKVHRAALDFLDDKLAYIHGSEYYFPMSGPSYYEIWVLYEYGVMESWNKVWKIGPTDIPHTDDVLFPLGFFKNGEYLLLTDSLNYEFSGSLYLYNLGTEENEYLELQHPNPKFWWFVRYTESLVSVKRVNDAYK